MKTASLACRRVSALSLIVALGLGSSDTALALTAAEVAGLTGPDRQKILEDGARKEGELLWVGSFNEENAKPILDGFKARYPYITVNRVRTDSVKALQRVLAEVRARTPRTDLITSSSVLELGQADAVQAFKSPVLDLYPPSTRDPEGKWAALYFTYVGFAAYNTDLVPDAQAPRAYDDLLDPKWKGQMVWSNGGSTGAPFFITFLRMQWGEDKALTYLEKLSKQSIVTRTSSGRTVLGMTVSGEHKIMIAPYLSHIAEGAKQKAPIAGVMVDPVPFSPSPFLMAKGAPHPHATMLLIDYLLDKEAQTVLRDARYYPAHPDVPPADELLPYLPKSKGLKGFLLDDAELSKMLPESQKIFSRLFE